MAERSPAPTIYSIPAHRGFADALVAGLQAMFGKTALGLAKTTLLLPNRRAVTAVTEAFVRQAEDGLLLPRMVVIGDLELNEALGAALEPMGAATQFPPAVDALSRIFELARILAANGIKAVEAFRVAREMAATLDRLYVEDIALRDLREAAVEELAEHWQVSLKLFLVIERGWRERLQARGEVDAAQRRNLLLRHAAKSWRDTPPAHPVIAAGITTAAPAVAELLRAVAFAPGSMLVLPDLDLALDAEIWEALGPVAKDSGEPLKRGVVTHPQYHLKLLLHRIGIARDEVKRWPRSGIADAEPMRSRVISNIFLPARESGTWRTLPTAQRSLSHVRQLVTRHPAEEAQAIAVSIREAIEEPGKRVALVTPDRGLAARVSAHLLRWDIAADDSAGVPLSVTPVGVLLLDLAEVFASGAAPVALLAALKHPFVQADDPDERRVWLERVRQLDLALRGPKLAPGLDAIAAAIVKSEERRNQRPGLNSPFVSSEVETPRAGVSTSLDTNGHREVGRILSGWWTAASQPIAQFLSLAQPGTRLSFTDFITALHTCATALAGERVWSGAAGRQAADLFQQLAEKASLVANPLMPGDMPHLLRGFLSDIAVRPAYGSHPRVAIYGLLEARLQQADLVICAGLNEGVWPQLPTPDPILAPMICRELGLMPAEFRIGLAAHDLAGALGAPDVVLSRAERDASAPTVASRFLLRLQAMTGKPMRTVNAAVGWAAALDSRLTLPPVPQPAPMPSPEQRKVDLAVTDLDRLMADPFAFYARKILRLSPLDAIDADPSAAWRGSMVHTLLENWKNEDNLDPAKLVPRAEAILSDASAHPLLRAFWGPRLLAAIKWVAEETTAMQAAGRVVLDVEKWGTVKVEGITIGGKIDRIDRLEDGAGLAIIDYKTGAPPSAKQVQAGYALQLGLLGLIAAEGGFAGIDGTPRNFEYWSLTKNKAGGFGAISEPVLEGRRTTGLPRDTFVEETKQYLLEAIYDYINGNRPFTAKPNPNLATYTDYDQLMRLDEWHGRIGDD